MADSDGTTVIYGAHRLSISLMTDALILSREILKCAIWLHPGPGDLFFIQIIHFISILQVLYLIHCAPTLGSSFSLKLSRPAKIIGLYCGARLSTTMVTSPP